MNDFQSPQAILSSEQLKRLSETNNKQGMIRLLSPLGMLVLTTFGIQSTLGTFWVLSALFIHGLVLVSLFAPLHESIHYTAFRERWLNKGVARVCGFLLILPPGYFRYFHLAHHRYTQDLQRDPELLGEKPKNLIQYLAQMSGFFYWKERLSTTWLHATHRVTDAGFLPVAIHPQVTKEAQLFLGGYLLIALISLIAGSLAIFIYWIIPVLLAQPALRLYLLAEHSDCPRVPDMFKNTRTILTNRVIRHFMWEMPYHIEHHLYPSVPFYQLPTLYEIISQFPVCRSRGYVSFHKSYISKILDGGHP